MRLHKQGTRGTDAASGQRPVDNRKTKVIATLKEYADEYSNIKIIFYPTHQFPLARNIAALFQLAGWDTNFNETPQEGVAHRYYEGIEVSGFNPIS